MNLKKGAISVEASIVVPIVISVMLTMILLLKALMIQADVDEITSNTARLLSIYTSIDIGEEIAEINSAGYDELNIDSMGKELLVMTLGKQIDSNIVKYCAKYYGLTSDYIRKNSIKNIKFNRSMIVDKDMSIVVIIDYEINLGVPILGLGSIRQTSRAVVRSWFSGSEKTYWVSHRGTKYHVYGCKHIFKDIIRIMADDIDSMLPCKTCGAGRLRQSVYYKSSSGNHFHIKGCMHLFKNIKEITYLETENYTPCKTCIGIKGDEM